MSFRLFILGLVGSTLLATSQLVTLTTPTPHELADFLGDQGYDVAGYSTKRGVVSVVTEFPFLLELLQRENIVEFQVEAVEKTEPYLQYADRNMADDPDRNDETYLGADAILKELQTLAQRFPKFAKIYNLNDLLGTPATIEGRSIFALHISNLPHQIEDKPKILINGQHHARELMTQHAVLDAAKDLLESASRGDSTAKRTIENLSVWFVPVVNPDGLNHVLTQDRMWRKNRANNVGGSRGVDLNRNYSVKWGACGINSDVASSDVFKGISPDSEPEVKAMEALNAALHFTYSISYHSYGDEVLYPYLCGNLAESAVYHNVRDRLETLLNFGSRLPSSSGEDHEYHYNRFGTLAYLLELGDEFQPPFSSYRNQTWPAVQKVLPFIASEALSHINEFHVADAASLAPLQAQLKIKEINWTEGEQRLTDRFGTHRWRLPMGSYQLSVSAPGYETAVLNVSVNSEKTITKIPLRKSWGMLSLQDIGRWLFSFAG